MQFEIFVIFNELFSFNIYWTFIALTSCLALHLKSLFLQPVAYFFFLELGWWRSQRVAYFMITSKLQQLKSFPIYFVTWNELVAGVSQTCVIVVCCPLPFGWKQQRKSRESRQEPTKHTSSCSLNRGIVQSQVVKKKERQKLDRK